MLLLGNYLIIYYTVFLTFSYAYLFKNHIIYSILQDYIIAIAIINNKLG